MLTYKNYIGHASFDDEAELFHGEIINIQCNGHTDLYTRRHNAPK